MRDPFTDLDKPIFPPAGVDLRLSFPDMPLPEGLVSFAVKTNERCGDSDNAFDIYALSSGPEFKGVVLGVHGHADDGLLTHFVVYVIRKPGDVPPPSVIEGSEKLGGYPAALNTIFALFPSTKVKCDAKGEFFFPGKGPFPISKRELGAGALSLKHKELSYTIGDPNNPEGELTIRAVKDNDVGYFVEVEKEIELSISPSCIQEASMLLYKEAEILNGRRSKQDRSSL